MAEITAALVKELREKTGAGMMDCKAALQETNGDIEAAVDWLRKKGLAKAAKKAGRVAAEGLVAVESSGKTATAVEINSETDFVARNLDFQAFVREAAKVALNTDGTVAAVEAAHFPGGTVPLKDKLNELIATIEAAVGKPARINALPEQPGDVPLTSADVSKATRLLGFHPCTRIHEGVARYVEWFRHMRRDGVVVC